MENNEDNRNSKIFYPAYMNEGKTWEYQETPPICMDETSKIIESIEGLAQVTGFFSSRRLNMDQFDNNIYSDEEMMSSHILGSYTIGINYPYNIILYSKENCWKMDCLNLYYNIFKNISLNENHNLPKLLNIKRSNGSIQKAVIKDIQGFIIRKSRTSGDINEKIYVPVYFSQDNSVENLLENEGLLFVTKSIPLEELLDVNPNITEFNLSYKYLIIEENYTQTRKDITKYFNDKLKFWINNTLFPVLKRTPYLVKYDYLMESIEISIKVR